MIKVAREKLPMQCKDAGGARSELRCSSFNRVMLWLSCERLIHTFLLSKLVPGGMPKCSLTSSAGVPTPHTCRPSVQQVETTKGGAIFKVWFHFLNIRSATASQQAPAGAVIAS